MGQALSSALIVNALSALCAHAYFNLNENENKAGTITFLLLLPTFHVKLLSYHVPLLQAVVISFFVYNATLAASIVLYRISPFHPLYTYPGPFLCRVSKLPGVWAALHENSHHWTIELHRHYGPIVRTGPNELAVIDKELIPHILGAHGMPKGPIWDGRKFGRKGGREYDSLIESRVQEEHTLLRKPWNKAFSAGPVKGYERHLTKRVEQLVCGLENVCLSSVDGVGKVNMAEWVSFLAFDFMGDLAFGGAFDTLATGDPARYIQGMHKSMILPNITQHIPWSLSFLRTIPIVDAGMTNMMLFAQAQVKKRLKQTPNYPDLFHYLIEATEETDFGVDPEALMVQNSILAIVAGSDTTASVLSNAFYYLMLHPQYLMRLQAEINGAYAGSDFIDADSLTNLNYLNAVINETLRLQPAVPTYLNRAPTRGSGGKSLGKSMFIPEGTSIVVSPYAMHRDPRYFSPRSNDFWPDRWLKSSNKGSSTASRGEEPFILSRDAFIPFSTGPANCAGKPLALIELRLVIANVVRRFEIAFDDGYNPRRWEGELRDRFVMVKGELKTALKLRKTSGVQS